MPPQTKKSVEVTKKSVNQVKVTKPPGISKPKVASTSKTSKAPPGLNISSGEKSVDSKQKDKLIKRLSDAGNTGIPPNIEFYNTDTELLFREMCTIIQEHYKLDNLSDVVYKVIEDEYKAIKSKSAN